jgi:hypothetical protein
MQHHTEHKNIKLHLKRKINLFTSTHMFVKIETKIFDQRRGSRQNREIKHRKNYEKFEKKSEKEQKHQCAGLHGKFPQNIQHK